MNPRGAMLGYVRSEAIEGDAFREAVRYWSRLAYHGPGGLAPSDGGSSTVREPRRGRPSLARKPA